MSCRNEILMEIRSEMFSFFYFSASVWSKIFALIAYFAFHVFRAIRKKSRYWLSCQGSGVPLGCLGWTVGSFQRAVGPGALLWLNLCDVNPSTPAVLRPSVLGGSLRIPCHGSRQFFVWHSPQSGFEICSAAEEVKAERGCTGSCVLFLHLLSCVSWSAEFWLDQVPSPTLTVLSPQESP